MPKLDKYQGCLIGGAAGDALGYTVEFLSEDAIATSYGSSGITEYELTAGLARVSDDTQMTLFTANGLLFGATRAHARGVAAEPALYIGMAYRDWLLTQTRQYPLGFEQMDTVSWLMNVPELYARRAPGTTCLTALGSPELGSMEAPINNSKGCGGVMRVAPIGLYFGKASAPAGTAGATETHGTAGAAEAEDPQAAHDPQAATRSDDPGILAAQAAALTHGHELGYIPAATLGYLISALVHENASISQAVQQAIDATQRTFAGAQHLPEFITLMNKAQVLASQTTPDQQAIHQLGEGWVAEEALAIATYCALKYPRNIHKALVAAVNHGGDSDSTGAITGNIVGAYVGLAGMPAALTQNLELRDVILQLATDLHTGCPTDEHGSVTDPTWVSKYITLGYKPGR